MAIFIHILIGEDSYFQFVLFNKATRGKPLVSILMSSIHVS